MIIDSHAHIAKLPDPKFPQDFKEVRDLLLKEIKSSKTDHAIVIASSGPGADFASTEQILNLTNGIKNWSVVGSLDITKYTESDLRQLEEWLQQKKIVGFKFALGYQYFYPNDKRCEPIYKLCLKYDVPVIFHTGDTYSPDEKAYVKYAHPLGVDEVATDYPNLKIVIAHMGNPWLMDCAEVMYKNSNVYADISGIIIPGQSFSDPYIKVMKQRILDLAAYVGSAKKLLYGTDWPLAPMRDYIKFTKSLGFSREELDYVFYKNAKELFKI